MIILDERAGALEAVLFQAPDGAELPDLARALEVQVAEIETLLHELDAHFRAAGHGLRLQRTEQVVRLVTAPETGGVVRRFLGLERPARLSAAAMDTLAIIAYLQPVTRAVIEATRGVGSDHVLAVLLNLGLIEEVGRAETIGRPVLYGTTPAFLESAGLTTLEDLVPLPNPVR